MNIHHIGSFLATTFVKLTRWLSHVQGIIHSAAFTVDVLAPRRFSCGHNVRQNGLRKNRCEDNSYG